MIRYTRALLFPLVIISLLVVTGWAQAEPIVLRFSHVSSKDSPKGRMAQKFKELVALRFGSEMVVEVYPDSELFDDRAIFEALLLDDVQMGAPSLSKFKVYNPQMQVFDLPFMFKNMTAVDRFQKSKAGQGLLHSFEDRGLVGLGYLHNGLRQMTSNKKIVLPADAAGLTFRISGSDVLAAVYRAIGVTPVVKSYSQVYSLLKSGAVDGEENPWSNIVEKEFYTVQPYITETNHSLVDYMVVTSADFWYSLPDELRQKVQKTLDQAITYGNSLAQSGITDSRQTVVDSHQTEIVELSAAQRNQWIRAMKPVWKQFESVIGVDLINAANASNEGQ